MPGGEDVVHHRNWCTEFGPKVVRVVLCERMPFDVCTLIRQALRETTSAKFDYDLVDHGPPEAEDVGNVIVPGPSTGKPKMVEALDLLIYSLRESRRRYRRGSVFKLNEESTMTFESEQNVRDYMGKLCDGEEQRNVLTPQLDRVAQFLLNNPHYRGIPQLDINYNVVEVTCLFPTVCPCVPVHTSENGVLFWVADPLPLNLILLCVHSGAYVCRRGVFVCVDAFKDPKIPWHWW